MAVGDVDSDSDADLVVANQFSDTVSLFFNNGDGTFGERIDYSPGNPVFSLFAVTLNDLNNDGNLDLVTANDNVITDGTILVWLGNGDGSFGEPTSYEVGARPVDLTVSDVNGDEQLDLITSTVAIFLGNGDGTFGEKIDLPRGGNPQSLAIDDFDGDGDADVVTANADSDSISISTQIGSATKKYTYDPTFNRLTNMVDELGRRTLYSLDPANGNVLSTTYADGTRIIYTYTENGLVDTMTDRLGRVNDYSYDELGRLNGITYAIGTPDAASVRYEYDAAGNQTAFIDENGSRTEYEYDEVNQLVSITEADPDGDGALTSPVTTFVYDTAGNLIGTTDASGNSTRSTYDSVDRLISTIDPNGQETVYTYDAVGNLISFKDPLSQTTRSLYDERNRLIVSTDAEGNSTRYSYDIDNNTTEIIDPLGNKTTWRYDARSRVLSETDPLGNSTVYRYDAADNLIASVDRNDRLIEFEYDELNRPTKEIWIGDNQIIEYQYDLVGNLLAVTDQFSSLAFTYDNRDRLLSVDNSNTPNVPNVLLNYTYDSVGNILSATDIIDSNAGGTNTYTYDNLNRLIQLTQTGNNVSDKWVNMNYNPLSQLSEIQRYADIAGTQLVGNTNYTYDALNRLTNLNHSNSTTNLAFYNFVYDEASRITQIENIDGTTDYTYDKRSQLLGAEYSNTVVTDESYTYDKNGNRVSSTQHGENYQTGTNNRLLSDGVYNYEYDLSGNLIRRSEIATDAVREFEWDYRNRLVAVIDKNADGNEIQRVEFTYDAMNRRIAKTVDGVVTYFVYDGDNVLLDFVDTDGVDGEGVPVLAQRYLHGAGVDQILAQEDGSGNVVWHLADHLGTIRDLVDSSGEVVNHLTYDSYGNVVAETDDTVDSRYLYTGRELDAETGLYYYRARYYDAQVGRFIGEDPISFAGRDNNLYRYVANSPLQYRDPFGLIASKEHCDELRRQIYSTFTELVKKLEKYNPKTDAQGGHQYRHGSRSGTTQPGSHYQHIKDAQQSLKRQLTEYIKQCRKDDDDNQNPPIARFVDEAANRTIESPKTNNNNPIISNELQETLLEIINGLGKGLEVTLTLIGAGAGWLWTQIVQGLQ